MADPMLFLFYFEFWMTIEHIIPVIIDLQIHNNSDIKPLHRDIYHDVLLSMFSCLSYLEVRSLVNIIQHEN